MAEAHMFTIIKVARDEDLHGQIGKNIYFDLVDHDKVRSFRIKNPTPFAQFKEEVAKELGVPVQHQRFWLWAKRQNHTYRPNCPLTPQEESQSVGHLREVSNKANNAELKLFLEVEVGQDLRPIPPPEKTKDDILLFFKLYDPSEEELRYVGRLFVKGTGKPIEILSKLNELAGFGREEELELFEEIKFKPNLMCEHIDKKLTFRGSQLEDGDIICFQKAFNVESTEACRFADVPSFLEYVHNRQVVRFRSLEKPKEDEFSLQLSKLNDYDDVVERVAGHLNLDDPSKIRLTSHNCNSQQPKPQPIKYRGLEHLSDMLAHYNQTSDILYYEVLDIPLPELQDLKTLKVDFHHATKDEVVIHTIRLPKQSTVGDVINDLKTKVDLSHKDAELRLLEVFYHKIYKIYPLNEKIEKINDKYWTLRAEEIPEEEKDLDLQDRLIHVYHVMKDTAQNQVQNFGEPFFLVIHEGETLADVKIRIQKKLQVPDEEFLKWKFAFLSLGRPTYLQDSDIVSSYFQRRDVYGAWEQYLGLEHSDDPCKRHKRVNAANQVVRFRSLENPKEDKFSLELPKLIIYDDVVKRVASHLNLDDPSKIRLTSHDCYSQQPPQPIKYHGVEHLSDMLAHYNQTSDILYDEILDIPMAEAHMYTIIKVASDGDLHEQIGKNIYFDLVDHDKVLSFCIKKQTPFAQFKEEVAKELGIPVQHQRFWLWIKRVNLTYRPHRPLTLQEESQSVGHLLEVSNKANNAELKLFLEVEVGQDLRPIPPPEKTKEEILLFFKLYDPSKEDLRYVGRLFVKGTGKPIEILSKLNELAGFGHDEELELFEEVKFKPYVMCGHIDMKLTFLGSQLQDGDIICFQKALHVESTKTCRYPDVPSFLKYVHNRQTSDILYYEVLDIPVAEAHMYTIIKVASDGDLHEQIGKNIFDLVDHDKVRSFRIQNQTPFAQFKEEVAKELGIPVQHQRFWLWAKRQNHTYRPIRPLTPREESHSVGYLRKIPNKPNNDELKLFLEVEVGQDLQPIPPPEKTWGEILLFFKHYDPSKEELRYVGRLFVKRTGKPTEILSKLNELAGFGHEEELELFEEIKFEPNVMCEHIDKKLTFRGSQLEDGDIICFQKALNVESTEACRYPDVPSFLEYVHNRQVVRFRSLDKPKEDKFPLELSKLHNYNDVVERVAGHLNLDDPSRIRLYSHNCYAQQPEREPFKYHGVEHLSDMLGSYIELVPPVETRNYHHWSDFVRFKTSDILYYEVLDILLPELQSLKTLRVAFHHATKDKVVIHTIILPKQSTVGDVINVLKTKVELSHKDAELRLVEVLYLMIIKIFPLNEKIENINDKCYWTLRAEEIPEEEKDLDPQDRVIQVYHFTKRTAQDLVQPFGKPFFFVIREGETLADVKVRIKNKLQVPDEEFSKWKFAFLSSFRPTYLQDSDVVSSHFQVYGTWKHTLGLEHSINTPKRSYAANQQRIIQTHVSRRLKRSRSLPLPRELAFWGKRARTSTSSSTTQQEKIDRIIKEHGQLRQYTTAQHEFLVEQTRDMNEMQKLLQKVQALVPGFNVPQHLLSTVRAPPSPPVIFDDATTSQPHEEEKV